jgi:hypothetical protein
MVFTVAVPDEHTGTASVALPLKSLETWRAREWVPECACFVLAPKVEG